METDKVDGKNSIKTTKTERYHLEVTLRFLLMDASESLPYLLLCLFVAVSMDSLSNFFCDLNTKSRKFPRISSSISGIPVLLTFLFRSYQLPL